MLVGGDTGSFYLNCNSMIYEVGYFGVKKSEIVLQLKIFLALLRDFILHPP